MRLAATEKQCKDLRQQILHKVIPVRYVACHFLKKCDAGYGTDAFFDLINRKLKNSSLVMMMGSTCSEVTKTIAEIVPYWNLILLNLVWSHRVPYVSHPTSPSGVEPQSPICFSSNSSIWCGVTESHMFLIQQLHLVWSHRVPYVSHPTSLSGVEPQSPICFSSNSSIWCGVTESHMFLIQQLHLVWSHRVPYVSHPTSPSGVEPQCTICLSSNR
ncbi:hypothetical protein Btru_055557 [Bulinus truncatus]|nr:hypothetical protein Btru_055557 [Bulinus truncatus]